MAAGTKRVKTFEKYLRNRISSFFSPMKSVVSYIVFTHIVNSTGTIFVFSHQTYFKEKKNLFRSVSFLLLSLHS